VYAEAPELADLRAPCGAAGRNFYYSCCFRTLRGSAQSGRRVGEVSRPWPTSAGRRYSRIKGSLRRDATRG
jgi:hypothetical protein